MTAYITDHSRIAAFYLPQNQPLLKRIFISTVLKETRGKVRVHGKQFSTAVTSADHIWQKGQMEKGHRDHNMEIERLYIYTTQLATGRHIRMKAYNMLHCVGSG